MLQITLTVTFVPNSALPIVTLFESITLSLYLHRYKILLSFPIRVLPSKESGTSPNGSDKHFPFLQTSPQTDISTSVSVC